MVRPMGSTSVVELPHTATVATMDEAMRNPNIEAVLLRRGGALLAVFLRVEPGRVFQALSKRGPPARPFHRAA